MNVLKSLAVLVALVPLAGAGCSSAPGEEVGTSAADLDHCGPGKRLQCGGTVASPACECVASACSYAGTFGPTSSAYVQAFATTPAMVVNQALGDCPEIAGADGAWKQIRPAKLPWNGVPTDTSPEVPTCVAAFPGAVSGTSCCTYVWWPAGYAGPSSNPPAQGWATQDPSVLCTPSTTAYAALISSEECGLCHGAVSCADCRPAGP